MAQKLSGSRSKDATKQLNLEKRKLATEKRVISPGNQEKLNKMILDASKYGKTKRVERLLKAGANIEAKDNDNWTPLMIAAMNGHTQTCALLLEHNASIDAKENDGRTALIIAANNGRTQTCALLIGKGADVNAKAEKGYWKAKTGSENAKG
ncbi:MAG: ankyrin repeat domain-containing protein, partial [Candidatus Micrarchaeota archaeon]|nr:ankyrin repeat domain-containing protein [Candidatus Micrarchaeota archaeon]